MCDEGNFSISKEMGKEKLAMNKLTLHWTDSLHIATDLIVVLVINGMI